ncbi:type IV pilus secretin PilQ [Gammaproteobacteria bacterium AH-315-E17]|nr:type IV pilus secretin PilQ [Gammaproteobacteria bacterium AH-315-E17]
MITCSGISKITTSTSKTISAILLFCSVVSSSVVFAQQINLEAIDFVTLPGKQLEIELTFDNEPPTPAIFEIANPARLSMDFNNVSNRLTARRYPLDVDLADSVMILEDQNRTRMIVNLNNLQPYSTRVQGNSLFIVLGDAEVASNANVLAAASVNLGGNAASQRASDIAGVDFRRGNNGEGQIMIQMADNSLTGDIDRSGSSLILEFRNAVIDQGQQARLDVSDFATPVQFIDVYEENGAVMIVANVVGEYEYIAYQSNDQFIIDVSAVLVADGGFAQDDFNFSGERMSLNFQDIPIRQVLQIFAEFQNFSLVVSDAVTGDITLRLVDVPWDQALDLVLRSRGLGQRQEGSVLYVAPAADIAQTELEELEANREVEALVPLETAYISVNYAVASEMLALIQGGAGGGMLSDRGSVTVDTRTNTLIIQDAPVILAEVRGMLERLDVPVQQVLIEARIVNAETSFGDALGIRWGGVQTFPEFGDEFILSGSLGGFGSGFSDGQLAVDLGPAASNSSFAIGYAGDNGLLQLELAALEDSGTGEVVGQPSITTQDQQMARIESGLQFPYQSQAGGTAGGSVTEFISAVLSLEVTPQITPDGRIIMLLDIHQDSVVPTGSGVPAINTNNITTRVLVDDGETIVLGGVFREEATTTVSKTMFFGDLPYIGGLFRRTENSQTKTELLIFITPSILNDI